MPQISVIIPAFNAQAWIHETLRSVLGLDYPRELLDLTVVDDGSTDRTPEVARSVLAGTSINWTVQSCGNGGPSRARNLGARLARGKWLQFLDADDLLTTDKLRNQGTLASEAAPNVAVIHSLWAVLEQSAETWKVCSPNRKPTFGEEPIQQLLESENFIATGSQLFQRDWFERVGGFDERLFWVEDVDLALRIAMAGGEFLSAASDQPLFLYRKHNGSLSGSDAVKFFDGCVRNARMAEQYWRRSRKEISAEKKTVLLGIYGNALRAFYPIDRERFFALLAHVKTLDPTFRPAGPRLLKSLSGLVGYPNAEAVAQAYRRVKRLRQLSRLSERQ